MTLDATGVVVRRATLDEAEAGARCQLACWEEARFESREQMFHEAYSAYKEAAVGVRGA